MKIIQYMFVTSFTSALVYDNVIYANEGDEVNLTCNLQTLNSVTWLGPPNLQLYAVGNYVNTRAFPELKLIRYGDTIRILKIFNYTYRYQGQYRCQTKEGDTKFTVFSTVNPSNINIVNESTSNEIDVIEGQKVQLICRIDSGRPKETLSWSNADALLVEGGPGNISYSFIPTRYDNGKTFTCSAYRISTHILLMRNIRVSVYFIPNVLVEISPSDTVVEGPSLVISCIHDSNDKDATIRWIPECKEILKTNGQCRIASVKRTDAGTYTCEVDSKVGTVQNITTLDILYAPDISISTLSINDSCICLECIAKGIPDVPVFANWQHKSFSGTPIRLLANSSVLCIRPNSYKDHGIYICNVTNHIPNNDGEIWFQNAYNNTYSGPPYFTNRNKGVQYAALKKLLKFYFYVVSSSKVYTSLPGINNISISSKDIDDVIYDINVKVTGYEIIVETIFDDVEDFGNFTIHLTNAVGTTKFDFEVKAAEKQLPKSQGFTMEFALILGMVHIMIFLCWFGVKALKNRQLLNRIQERETASLRNDRAFARPVHYDEIDSMYYNLANLMVSPQITRNNAQRQTSTENTNFDNHETNSSTSQNTKPCSIQGFESSNEINSLRSSSDESYLVPCRHYIDFDIQKVNDNENQDKRTGEQETIVEESSISSDNSETNTKSIQRYETLKVSDVNEYCYKKYNDIHDINV